MDLIPLKELRDKNVTKYTIVAYSDWDSEEHYTFGANTKREVVGLMKTIMDNFNPAHVDIMRTYDDGD